MTRSPLPQGRPVPPVPRGLSAGGAPRTPRATGSFRFGSQGASLPGTPSLTVAWAMKDGRLSTPALFSSQALDAGGWRRTSSRLNAPARTLHRTRRAANIGPARGAAIFGMRDFVCGRRRLVTIFVSSDSRRHSSLQRGGVGR